MNFIYYMILIFEICLPDDELIEKKYFLKLC